MKVVTQKRVVQVIQREVSHFVCDRCGSRCGTRENPKETWYASRKASHYCKRTCSPRLRRNEEEA